MIQTGSSSTARKFQWIGQLIWKELFEVFRRPLAPIALLTASVFVVWTSGKLTTEREPLRVFLYKGGAASEQLYAARAALNVLAQVEITEVDGSVVRPDDMVREGASLAVVLRGGRWLILRELPTSRQEENIELLATTIDNSLNNSERVSVVSFMLVRLTHTPPRGSGCL